jgi:acetylornithine deacetylase/succinyl-diaminopimelate desuccinylase-like protein
MGTLIPNPAWRLVWALAALKDANDNILIDGLNELVEKATAADTALLQNVPFNESAVKAEYGISGFVRGLSGIEAVKKHFFEPTCNICGLKAGYIDPGVKTVVPAAATAKLDFRLVPRLEPGLVADLVRKHLERRGFGDIEVALMVGEHAARTPADALLARVAVDAATMVYGVSPVVMPLSPASGPMYPLTQALGTPAVSAGGVGHAGSGPHAPNENISIEDYFDSIHFVGELIRLFAE